MSPVSSTVVFSIPKNKKPSETTEFKNPYKIKSSNKFAFLGKWTPLVKKITIATSVDIKKRYVKNKVDENPASVNLITGEATPQIIATTMSIK